MTSQVAARGTGLSNCCQCMLPACALTWSIMACACSWPDFHAGRGIVPGLGKLLKERSSMEPLNSKHSEAGHAYHHLPSTRYRSFRSARAQALSNAICELHQVVHQATWDVAISHPPSHQSSQLQRWRSQSSVNHMMLAVNMLDISNTALPTRAQQGSS